MKIGNKFETDIPDSDIEKIMDVGGYKFIIKKDGEVMIQGIGLVSINKAMIGIIGILPLDEETQLKLKDFPFEIEKHHLIYQVTFNGFGWYFKNKENAFVLMNLILQVKEVSLHNKFIKDIKVKGNKK